MLAEEWLILARDDQLPPDLGAHPCTRWLVMGGRGAGKTRTGAEYIKGLALGLPWLTSEPVSRIALIGETFADAREVMVEGPAGLLAVHARAERPQWTPSRRRLEWKNGAVAHVFSAEDPQALRGPQFGAAWADELAKWRHVEEAWDMLQFGLRLGAAPRAIVTTTPRPIPLIKNFLADPAFAVSRARTPTMPEISRRAFSRRRHPLWRHAPRAPGTRRRDRRGASRCALDPRADRGMPRRSCTAARAHRRRDRSARVLLEARRRLRDRRGRCR